MSRTVQIEDLDDELYTALQRRADQQGVTVAALIGREAIKLALEATQVLSMQEWQERVARLPRLDMSDKDVNETLDELRGPWPEPDGAR